MSQRRFSPRKLTYGPVLFSAGVGGTLSWMAYRVRSRAATALRGLQRTRLSEHPDVGERGWEPLGEASTLGRFRDVVGEAGTAGVRWAAAAG